MNKGDILKCPDCGCLIESLTGCGCKVSACGEAMQPKTVDQGMEKHVPVVESTENGIKVTVGSVAHPMDDTHWINFIEVIAGDYVHRKYLNPGDAPEAFFPIKEYDVVREYCNLHGLWKAV